MRERYQQIVEEQWDQVRKLYAAFEDEKPIIVVEVQAEQITAHSYEEFKAQMVPADQVMLEEQYTDAVADDKIIIFVRDDDAEQLVSFTVDPERADAAFEQRVTQRQRKTQRHRRTRRRGTQHGYSKDREADDWLVPYIDGGAVIHHGHEDPDDHSFCGPRIFCCAKAAGIYVEMFPDSPEARAEWELTKVSTITGWMDAGANAIYFIFCDPERPMGLLFIGLFGETARQVVEKQVPLEEFAADAGQVQKMDH